MPHVCAQDSSHMPLYLKYVFLFNIMGMLSSSQQSIVEIVEDLGVISEATFDLQLRDIRGDTITGQIPIGRMVRLHATVGGIISKIYN